RRSNRRRRPPPFPVRLLSCQVGLYGGLSIASLSTRSSRVARSAVSRSFSLSPQWPVPNLLVWFAVWLPSAPVPSCSLLVMDCHTYITKLADGWSMPELASRV